MKRMMTILGCLFPIIGAVCIFFPEYVTKGLPYLLGGAMVVDGAAQIVIYIQSRSFSSDSSDQLARGLVLLIMGCAFMLQGARSLGAIGITWSIIGSYDVLKASCAIPYVCRPQIVDGVPYYDGALGAPIPIEKAFELGCDWVILILTLPADTVRDSQKDRFLAGRIRKKYPLAAQCLEHRAGRYNIGVAQAEHTRNRANFCWWPQTTPAA